MFGIELDQVLLLVIIAAYFVGKRYSDANAIVFVGVPIYVVHLIMTEGLLGGTVPILAMLLALYLIIGFTEERMGARTKRRLSRKQLEEHNRVLIRMAAMNIKDRALADFEVKRAPTLHEEIVYPHPYEKYIPFASGIVILVILMTYRFLTRRNK